ncbi:Uncharacterised protein [Klebsiella pneumoniae]|nr:Uncharacterised protein [Klebsiella pneumoniae]
MKASAALCPPPIMAIFIGLPLLQGCLAMCSRYWLWWNTRPSPLSARNTCGIRGVPPGLTTRARVVRTSSSPSALREITRSASTWPALSIGSMRRTSSP